MRKGIVVAIPLLSAAMLGALSGSVAANFVRVPRVSELESYRPDIITEIRGSDGSTIARYAIERRILVSRSEIPPSSATRSSRRKKELLQPRRRGSAADGPCADDQHPGAAPRAGGSTLTQQLARDIFLSPKKTISRKVNEALVASRSTVVTRRTRS